MWKILQEALPWLLIILIISQIIIPVISDTPMFWMFRRKAKKVSEPVNTPIIESELATEVQKTKETVQKTKETVKTVQEKVDKNFKSAEELKKDTDSLLP